MTCTPDYLIHFANDKSLILRLKGLFAQVNGLVTCIQLQADTP